MVGRSGLAAVAAAALFALVGFGVVACGDDTGSSATAPPTDNGGQASERSGSRSGGGDDGGGAEQPTSAGDEKSGGAAAPPHRDSGGGVEQFVTPGGDNSVQEFGSEAEGSEFEEAAAALHAFLDARASGDWTTACEHLANSILESFQQLAGKSSSDRLDGSCPELLKALSGPGTADARAEAAIADVGAMRAEGNRGFLLYRGAGGTDYAIPMAKEGGAWKVGAMAGLPLS